MNAGWVIRMAVNLQIQKSLERLTFRHRETSFEHQSYSEDIRQYEMVRRGDPQAVEFSRKLFRGPNTGKLSEDRLKNYQYLFVASITLACRFCIEGGLNSEVSYNLSDLYIIQADRCKTVEEIWKLHDMMIRDYTARMVEVNRRKAVSLHIRECLELIDQHLQEPITAAWLAKKLNLSQPYLSTIFKREMEISLTGYVREKRIEQARILLECTQYSCAEIAEYLCFSSDAHFSNQFRSCTGKTPREYRKEHYGTHWDVDSIRLRNEE